MPEGSGGPWTSPSAQVSAQPGDSSRIGPADLGGEQRIPNFPVERAERGIHLLSRFAGPAIFFLALGGIVWLLVK
jgi:hypothetical protein